MIKIKKSGPVAVVANEVVVEECSEAAKGSSGASEFSLEQWVTSLSDPRHATPLQTLALILEQVQGPSSIQSLH